MPAPPGFMDQGHKPDEFVSLEQLHRYDAMLGRLITEFVSRNEGEGI